MQDADYIKLLDKLSQLHYQVMKRDILDNPTQTGDYMTQIRGYANFILPYINKSIDKISEAEKACAVEREKIYKRCRAEGVSSSGAEKEARESTRLLDVEFEIAKREADKMRNDYRRFDSLVLTMQSRLKEFNTDKMLER